MRISSKKLWTALSLVAGVAFAPAARAAWEVGIRGAADSNVLRSVGGHQSDQYLFGYLSYGRPRGGDRTLDWDLTASLEGAAYREINEFTYGAATVAPGVIYSLLPGWTVAAAPFVQAKVANDSDLSAFAFGGRLTLQQQIGSSAYTGEYYRYTDSRAKDRAFSYRENAVGAFAGYGWTSALWTEIAYQFAHGDSYRVDGAVSGGGSGGGMMRSAAMMASGDGAPMGGHGSSSGSLEADLVGETVDSHEATATVGYGWTPKLSTVLGYSFGYSHGSFGRRESHTGFLGSAYRF